MIKKEDIKKWLEDQPPLWLQFDKFEEVVHKCITELSQDKWVSVEDRLPDDESVVGKILLLINGKYPVIGAYSDTCGKFATYGGVVDEATHWMPLELPNDKMERAK